MDCQKIEILLGQRSILFKAKKANTWLEARLFASKFVKSCCSRERECASYFFLPFAWRLNGFCHLALPTPPQMLTVN